jgi:acetyl-CoA carboxylase beta subunit
MSSEAGALTFSRASAQQRIDALLDPGSVTDLLGSGRVLTARGSLAGRRVHVAASDASVAHGAIGTQEADALIRVLEAAQAHADPMVWLLDSAGANVEQGLAALGAFRRLFRAALSARTSGVRMLALLGRSCFGGASMLACLCHARSYLPQTRLATSGPAVIQAAAGADELNASDQLMVSDLMGSASRLALHAEDTVREDTLPAARSAAASWLSLASASPSIEAQHAQLGERLRAAGVVLEAAAGAAVPEPGQQRAASALLPRGYRPTLHGSLFSALPTSGSERALFLGAMGGAPIGAVQCWILADWLLAAHTAHSGSPVVLVLDSLGHAARVLDERVLLSDYLVHVSLVVDHLRRNGHRCVLWIPGDASGASYVAFAAAVDRVSALPSARIAVLPSRAVQQILRQPLQSRSEDWFETGVADALLDERLAGSHADPPEESK